MTGAPSSWILLSLTAVVAAGGCGGFTIIRGRASGFLRAAGLAILALALAQLGGVGAWSSVDALGWRRVAIAGTVMQMASVFALVASLGEPRAASGGRRLATWWMPAVAVALAASAWSAQVVRPQATERGMVVTLGSMGLALHAAVMLGLVFGLAQLESTLRATRDPLRYRVKFVLLGIGAASGYRIYETAQVLLLRTWSPDLAVTGALTTLASVALAGFGLARTRLREVSDRVAVSPRMVRGSVTLLAVGAYLFAAGLLAQLLRVSGRSLGPGLGGFLLFLASVGLVVASMSRSVRAVFTHFVDRHFFQSRYDYRAQWLEVTEAFEASASVDGILDQFLHLLSRTFRAERISIWMRFDADDRFRAVRSVNVERPPDSLASSHPIVKMLAAARGPLTIESAPAASGADPDPFFAYTRAGLLVPITVEQELLAFVALSADQLGSGYGIDDIDLVRVMARHVEVLLSHARLAEERRASAELEALHRLSAFWLHDLKTLTARLSLVAQNAAQHADSPEFREAAIRTVARTADEMSRLMAKLSLRRDEESQAETFDLHALVTETVGSLDSSLLPFIRGAEEGLPPVSAVRKELRQVLINLLLNARQAVERDAPRAATGPGIEVHLGHHEGKVTVTVADDGPGIPAAQLRTLFLPFRTTRPGGLGIGLYQCRRLVEANHGRLFVESGRDRGTEVRIELPAQPRAAPVLEVARGAR
jgi:putative PEP-CTERM system histidine kinase